MKDEDAEALTPEALIAKWRQIADVWEHQLHETHTPDGRVKGLAQSPVGGGRSNISNWINWLRDCANELEAALANGEAGGPS